MLISFLLYHFLTSIHESKWVKGSSLRDIKQIEQITLLNWGRTSYFIDFLFGFRCPFLINMNFQTWFLILDHYVPCNQARFFKVTQVQKCSCTSNQGEKSCLWLHYNSLTSLKPMASWSAPPQASKSGAAPPKAGLALGGIRNQVPWGLKDNTATTRPLNECKTRRQEIRAQCGYQDTKSSH